MTVQVRDRHNRCYVAFEDKEHAERKAMKNGSAKFTKDARKLQRPTFNSREGVTKFAEEFRPEADLFAFIPHAGLERIEFCLRPNVEPDHLLASSKTVLNSFDHVPPRPGLAR